MTICSTNNCIGDVCTFTAIVDLYASELGYFTFAECGSKPNPTIGLEIGKKYIFDQSHRSNYYHPLGFAYWPDGAKNPIQEYKLELMPSVIPPNVMSFCNSSLSCPSPQYFINDTYVGVMNTENFGLDDYEPKFFHPLSEWASYGRFSVELSFELADYDQDLFYFCHIHKGMSGRIKLLKDGAIVNEIDEPILGYSYDIPGKFDQSCGTYNLDNYQLPNSECPATFVCGKENEAPNIQKFSNCIDAMNCAMMVGMTTNIRSGNEMVLFIHNMIPHHQNAVNMAKALLKTNTVKCDDLASEEDSCVMEAILRDIVNGQNAQIQQMYMILKNQGYPLEDDCIVPMSVNSNKTSTSSGFSFSYYLGAVSISLALFSIIELLM